MIADFAAEDLLLVVEFLTYALPGEDPDAYKAADCPELIEGGARLCLDAGSKVLKIPYPGTPASLRQHHRDVRARCPGRCSRPASITRPSSARSRPPWRTAPPA